MDIRLGARRFRYDFDALSGRVLDATWPYYRGLPRRGRSDAGAGRAVGLEADVARAAAHEQKGGR